MTNRPGQFRAQFELLDRRLLLASTSTLLQYDFTSGPQWQQTPGQSTAGVTAALLQGGVGTIDTEGGTTPSGGLRLTVSAAPATPWSSDLTSGPLAVSNTETNLGKLTLGFSLSVSQLKPVRVVVTSYDAAGGRTGALATVVNPASTYTYQRYALDLSTMTASGTGTFNPAGPKVSFDFGMDSRAGWTTDTAAQLRLDNVNYAKPAYYVKAVGGSNSFDGKTEATAFATPQKALDVSQPGDIILMMNGTYNQVSLSTGAMRFNKGGTPAAWVTVKNYPGQSPRIYNEAWNAISIGASNPTTAAAVAYVEIRGLHVQGGSAKVGTRSAPDPGRDPSLQPPGSYGPNGQYLPRFDAAGKFVPFYDNSGNLISAPDPRVNGNGISIDGRKETNKPHDIRIVDNWVEDNSGGGINALDCDRVQIENNLVQDNCYWDQYATSGISVLSSYNFEGTSGTYTRLVRNNVTSGNIHKVIWAAVNKYSDGNGIIIDINHTPATEVAAGAPYLEALGRTLVTNNISFDNGGSGIHAYGAYHVDIINNVAYLNSASPHLQYGAIFAGSAGTADSAADVNIFNNILVAPVANTAAGEAAEPLTGGRSGSTIQYKNNVYFGGNIPANTASWNTGNVTADPKFVLPSVNPATANFRLQSTSPAINLGLTSRAPNLDITNAPHYAAPDAGVYEFVPTAPTSIALAATSDTGIAGDNKTRLNNATPATKLSFVVTGTLSGATVNLYSGTALLGTATANGTTTTVITDGVTALADGNVAITASQTFAGAPSGLSSSLGAVIDAVLPSLVGTPLVNAAAKSPASRSQVSTISWTFTEPVLVGLGNFVLTSTDTGQTVNLALRAVTASGNTVTLSLDRHGIDSGASLFLADGNYRLTLSPAVTDTAGNALDANGDGTPGDTPTFSFFKLTGDYDGDRRVNFNDFLRFQSAFGSATNDSTFDPIFDHNGDGAIDFNDFLFFQSAFGSSV